MPLSVRVTNKKACGGFHSYFIQLQLSFEFRFSFNSALVSSSDKQATLSTHPHAQQQHGPATARVRPSATTGTVHTAPARGRPEAELYSTG